MGRRIDMRRRGIAALLGVSLAVRASGLVAAELPAVSDPRAVDRFHAAAALQNRELYELAAAEWAAFANDFPADPLVASARYQRGVCLFQLQRFDDARTEFEALLAGDLKIDPEIEEQCYAQSGLSHYNLALAAEGDERTLQLRASVAAFDQQLQQFPVGTLAPRTEFYRCEALYALGRLTAAIRGYQVLFERYPDHPQRADALYALGVAEQEAGQLAEAATTFAQFAAAYPHHESAADACARRGESLLAWGEKQLEVGKAEEAIAVLAEAAALPPWTRSDEVLLALAEARHTAGKASDAISTIDRLIAEFPQSATLDRAWLCRAKSHVAIADWWAAIDDFDTLIARWPHSPLVPQALVARARAQLHNGDRAAAEKSLDRFLENYPQHKLAQEVCVLRATVRHERGNFAGGVADADAVLAADPTRPVRSDALYIRGLCQLALRKSADAADSFERIVDKDPQYGSMDRVLYDLAWAYQNSHDAERAIATFARLAETHPESPLAAESWYRIGEAEYAAGEYVVAAANFARTLELAREPAVRERAMHKLAWCRFEQQEFAAAERAFAEQLTTYPQGALAADARLLQAECSFRQCQYREALDAFLPAIDLPAATGALRQSALLHAAQSAGHVEQWQRCLELADRAIAEFPSAPWIDEARCERGAALFHLDRLDDAQQEFAALAASREPTGARAQYMLGRIQTARGQTDEAIRTFFQVAYGYGDANAPPPYRSWQAESLYEAARCLEKTNRIESARKLYEELLDRHPDSAPASSARTALQQTLQR